MTQQNQSTQISYHRTYLKFVKDLSSPKWDYSELEKAGDPNAACTAQNTQKETVYVLLPPRKDAMKEKKLQNNPTYECKHKL